MTHFFQNLVRSLLVLCVLAAATGCSLLPAKKSAPAPASIQQAGAPGQSPDATESAPLRKKVGWREILFFWWPKPKPGPPIAAPLETSGLVSFVNIPANFVILETPSSVSLAVGQELSSIKDGRIVSRVKVTEDRRAPFVVAEILEGTPGRGDRFHPVVLD